MKDLSKILLEKLKIDKNTKIEESPLTDEEILSDGSSWKLIREFVLKFLPDFDEYKTYTYYRLRKKDNEENPNIKIAFVYSFPPEFEDKRTQDKMKKEIINIQKKDKKLFTGDIDLNRDQQNLILYFNN